MSEATDPLLLIYRAQLPGVAMWAGCKSSVRWDVAFPPTWSGAK
ncbi:MAG: hypothetical protein PGN30_13285 [Mycolicibacterium neoaurum]